MDLVRESVVGHNAVEIGPLSREQNIHDIVAGLVRSARPDASLDGGEHVDAVAKGVSEDEMVRPVFGARPGEPTGRIPEHGMGHGADRSVELVVHRRGENAAPAHMGEIGRREECLELGEVGGKFRGAGEHDGHLGLSPDGALAKLAKKLRIAVECAIEEVTELAERRHLFGVDHRVWEVALVGVQPRNLSGSLEDHNLVGERP